MAFVSLDNDGNIISIYGTAQNKPLPPGYTVIADDDARIAAFQAAQVVQPDPVLQIVSVSTPSLNGTYSIDERNQEEITSVAAYIAINQKFPDGLTQLTWPDTSGTLHVFTSTTEFLAFATSVADYVTAAALGNPPQQPITIGAVISNPTPT